MMTQRHGRWRMRPWWWRRPKAREKMNPSEQQHEILQQIRRGAYWKEPKGYGLALPGETHIADLGLSMTTFNCLFQAGIFTVERIQEIADNYGYNAMLKIPLFGPTRLEELRGKLPVRYPVRHSDYNPELPQFRAGGHL